MKLSGAIFDMDGTLLDSMPYWRNILPEYLQMPIDSAYKDKISNMNVTESVILTIETFNIPKKVKQVFDEMCELMKHHYLNDVAPLPGVIEYLRMLKENDIRMCVASASPPKLIRSALENFKMLDFFEFICSTEDGFSDKQSPDIYLYCAEKFGVPPHEIAVFEDSATAIETARNANFNVIEIKDRNHFISMPCSH